MSKRVELEQIWSCEKLKFLSKKSSDGQLDRQMAAQTDITDKEKEAQSDISFTILCSQSPKHCILVPVKLIFFKLTNTYLLQSFHV